MAKNRRNYERKLGQRRYKKLFILAVEGEHTERDYFEIVNKHNAVIHVIYPRGNHRSSPDHVLTKMEKHLQGQDTNGEFEAWIVIDKDQSTKEQLSSINEWSQEEYNYGFALSNPSFEFWLLLHFEDTPNVSTAKECTRKLKKHISNYNKRIKNRSITPEMIEKAIKRAKQLDNPPCDDWPRTRGTTVYRLVERMLDVRDD